MRFAGRIGAFIEIGPPRGPGPWRRPGNVGFKERKRDSVFDRPGQRACPFGKDDVGERVEDLDRVHVLDADGRGLEIGEFSGRMVDRDHVVKKDRAAGVDFEIEVAAAGLGFDEEFDAAVAADVGLILRVAGKDVAVVDTEMNVERLIVIQELGPGDRMVVAAAGMEDRDVEGRSAGPDRAVPESGQFRLESGRFNRVAGHGVALSLGRDWDPGVSCGMKGAYVRRDKG